MIDDAKMERESKVDRGRVSQCVAAVAGPNWFT